MIDYFFSLCDKAEAAMDFVLLLERPSVRAFDALEATFADVLFAGILFSFLIILIRLHY